MSRKPRVRILCVDDEPAVLQGIALTLGRRFEVLSAISGAAGLQLLATHADVAVVICDMCMPGMSGVAFFARLQAVAPEAVRILLTGQADVATAIAAVNEGQIYRYLTKPCAPAALFQAVEAALERYQSKLLERSIVRRKEEFRQLRRDPLTGLASRVQLVESLEASALGAGGVCGALAAFFVEAELADELDFAGENPAAGELPKILAERLQQHLGATALLARWDISQFVLIGPSAGESDAELLARGEALRSALAAPIPLGLESVSVKIAVGIARLEVGSPWQQLIQRAGLAVREARRDAGSQVRLYRDEVLTRRSGAQTMLKSLREALDQDGLHLHYQPIVDVEQGRVRTLEGLVRWDHKTLGSVPPARFVSLAEENGEIVRLGRWVLWRACHEGRQFYDQHGLAMAVNVSVHEVMDPGFLVHLQECLSHSGLPPEALDLELTESALASDMNRLRNLLEQLRLLGIRVSVDDFGTGYSSLSYLSSLAIDVIKVDQIFVRDFHVGGKSIIKAALAIARDFGRELIIEGVESPELLLRVRELGACLIQGYVFSKPLPSSQVMDWVWAYEEGRSAAAPVCLDRARTGRQPAGGLLGESASTPKSRAANSSWRSR